MGVVELRRNKQCLPARRNSASQINGTRALSALCSSLDGASSVVLPLPSCAGPTLVGVPRWRLVRVRASEQHTASASASLTRPRQKLCQRSEKTPNKLFFGEKRLKEDGEEAKPIINYIFHV